MRILYFEDDAIDQRLFKRACRNLEGLEVTYQDSCNELEEDYINSFDGIIVDQYLKDCSISHFSSMNITPPMAVLSASEKLVGSEEGFVGIWQKPIKDYLLKDILAALKKKSNKQNDLTVSFEYIEELTDGNPAEKEELLRSIAQSIQSNNNVLKNFDATPREAILQNLHQQKSKVGLFYLESLHGRIDKSENDLKNGATKEDVLEAVNQIVSETDHILSQLTDYLK